MLKLYEHVHYTQLRSDTATMKEHEKFEKEVKHEVNLFVAIQSDVSEEMKQKSEQKRTLNENVTTIVHILTIQFVLYILYLSFSHDIELFTWHPILLSIGWTLFMTEGILAISGENWFTKFISTKNRVLVHWVVQICASACIFSGFIIVIVNKNLKHKQHFQTWHGTMGLVSIIFFIPTCLIGVLTLYKIDLRHYISPLLNKVIHIFLGTATFILGVITVVLSLYSNWFVKKTTNIAQVVCFIAVVLTSLWIMLRPMKYLTRCLLNQL